VPRPPRLLGSDAIYHVTTRGNDGQAIYADDSDREMFLSIVTRVVMKHEWICHAYCLMTTHYHLLVATPNADLDRGMHLLNGHYARSFNRRHRRRDHLFGRRYFADLISAERRFLAAVRYIHMNPPDAFLCRDPRDWAWSSHGALCGVRASPDFLDGTFVLGMAGGAERLHAFVTSA
jgi:REP element-mobilizing transposase RayT